MVLDPVPATESSPWRSCSTSCAATPTSPIAWGLAVTMGIYIAGKPPARISTPPSLLTLAVFRGFFLEKSALPYWLVQIAGASCGAAIVFWNYHPQFLVIDPDARKTAGVFTTFPRVSPAALRRISRSGNRYRASPADDFRHHRRAQHPAHGSNMTPIMVGLVSF